MMAGVKWGGGVQTGARNDRHMRSAHVSFFLSFLLLKWRIHVHLPQSSAIFIDLLSCFLYNLCLDEEIRVDFTRL